VAGVTGVAGVDELEQAVMKPTEISMEKKVVSWANENPEDATGLVKGWLGEK
jgi:hypothetical protein